MVLTKMVLAKLLAGFTPNRNGKNMPSARRIVALVKDLTNIPVLSYFCRIVRNLLFNLNMIVSQILCARVN